MVVHSFQRVFCAARYINHRKQYVFRRNLRDARLVLRTLPLLPVYRVGRIPLHLRPLEVPFEMRCLQFIFGLGLDTRRVRTDSQTHKSHRAFKQRWLLLNGQSLASLKVPQVLCRLRTLLVPARANLVGFLLSAAGTRFAWLFLVESLYVAGCPTNMQSPCQSLWSLISMSCKIIAYREILKYGT